ncbi:hypothetical protein ACQP7F_26830, partial [Escherichia coli]|uniref:hypothetical protein n=2 Tax=Escherichia coli TaxID=562 RepID=UPI003CFFB03C
TCSDPSTQQKFDLFNKAKDMLTVLLQLYQTRVAGLILPVFSLQYHDQTDFVLSGEQPVLAPEGGVPD